MATKIVCKRCGRFELKYGKGMCSSCYKSLWHIEKCKNNPEYKKNRNIQQKKWRDNNKEKYRFCIAKSMVKALSNEQKSEILEMLKKGLRK